MKNISSQQRIPLRVTSTLAMNFVKCSSVRRVTSYQRLSVLRSTNHTATSCNDADGGTLIHNDAPTNYTIATVSNNASDGSSEPWKTLLEMPARAAWRVSDPHQPIALELAQRQLFQRTKGHYNQTLKHLKQVHESVIQSHKDLAIRRHRERLRTMQSEGSNADKRKDSKHQPVLYGPEETLASIRFRLYPNFSIVKRVLLEAKSLLGSGFARDAKRWHPKQILDFGIGCGSASLAALNVWDDDQIEWIHGVDPSEAMRGGAAAIFESYCQEMHKQRTDQHPPRLTLGAHLSSEIAPPSFDLVLFTHTATELPYGSSILAAAAVCWDKLKPNGLFVMIEPGTPDGFSSIRMVRNMLLDCVNTSVENKGAGNREACCIIAPCTHSGSCPMEQYSTNSKIFTQMDVTDANADADSQALNDTIQDREGINGIRKGFCSFVQTMPGHGGATRGEKFSYLVAQKRGGCDYEAIAEVTPYDGLAKALQEGLNASADDKLLARSLERAIGMEENYLDSDDDDLRLEVMRGDMNRSRFGRIVRSPLKKKGHIHIEYCCSPGRIERHLISKSMSARAPGIFAAARKARWGGFWPLTPSSRGGHEVPV
ncbi:hypothetical protein MPSEU_000522000 [Mayamaea pseudoterrestris]|nr:hypothetical protein MPSEU_000522000 [Mayamaea pseudoterrestris]